MTCLGFLVVFWCSDLPPPQVMSVPYCETVKPVRPSRKDTVATIEQADTEWRKFKALCGGSADVVQGSSTEAF